MIEGEGIVRPGRGASRNETDVLRLPDAVSD